LPGVGVLASGASGAPFPASQSLVSLGSIGLVPRVVVVVGANTIDLSHLSGEKGWAGDGTGSTS
jgi:hypothetical protein